jgi:hypothetical protein
MSAETRAIRTARHRLAIFWVLTVIYLVIIGALLVTLHDVLGIAFIAVLVCSWFLVRWPSARPHFAVRREARLRKKPSSG